MADMITRCPQCATAFRITAAHLKLAQGSVRCGACFTIFNALENLSERTPTNAPASNLADDFLISDHMGIEDDHAESSAENPAKSSLFERVEQAKAQPDGPDDTDESWAIALLTEEGLGDGQGDDSEEADDNDEEETRFRPFRAGADHKPIELSDDFLHASDAPQTETHTQKLVLEHAPTDGEQDWATSLSQEHPELNPDDLKDLQNALHLSRQDPTSNNETSVSSPLEFASLSSAPNPSRNAHLIERIELDPLEVTVRRAGINPRIWWSIGGLGALAALLVQIAVIKMPQWRYDTPLSGLYALACQKLTCPPDSRSDITKIHTKSLLVHEHPSRQGAFAVDAVIVNKASYVQPFPRLILSFRNLQNQLVSERIFLPAEYLGGEMAGERNMPIKQEIRISLEILDPGPEAVSYVLTAD